MLARLFLSGRSSAGIGIAVLSPSGKLRVAVGAPIPAPQVNGKVVERGGLGTLPKGAANGDDRAMLRTRGQGRPELLVCATAAKRVVNTLPAATRRQ